ncbi:MAG: hypothetical protein JKY54_06100 [Flavobacteriales bacterium]|nr:hypothetical protein [Flavobacteriales bacterium]
MKLSTNKIYTVACLMAIALSGCGSEPINTDTEAPSFDGFVIAVAEGVDQVSTAWMPASDDITAPNEIQYGLFYGDSKNFVPNTTSLYQTYTGETTATVTGLDAGTEYFFKVVASDAADNSTEADSFVSVVTSTEPSILTGITTNSNEDLSLGIPQVSGIDNSIYKYSKNASSVAPEGGTILIGENKDGSGYIRLVDTVSQDATSITINTSDATLHDVFERVSLSTEMVLRNPQQAASTPNSNEDAIPSTMNRSVNSSTGTKTRWKNRLLTITENLPTTPVQHTTSNRSSEAPPADNLDQDVQTNAAPLIDTSIVLFDTKAGQSLSVKGEITFEPSLKVDVETEGFTVTEAKTVLKGDLKIEVTLGYDYIAQVNISEDKTVFDRKYHSRYVMGGIPIIQETNFKLVAKVSGNATSAMKGDIKATIDSNVTINVDYDGSDWSSSSTDTFDKSLTVKADIVGTADAQVRFVPQVTVKYYSALATTITVEPYIKTDITAQAILEAELVANGIMGAIGFTNFDAFAGVDINFMTDFSILGKSIARYPVSGMKQLFNQEEQLFGLPTLSGEVEETAEGEFTFTGLAEPFNNAFGLENAFDVNSARWITFPEIDVIAGMTVDWSGETPDSIYFIGNSVMLGAIGRQYLKVPLTIVFEDENFTKCVERALNISKIEKMSDLRIMSCKNDDIQVADLKHFPNLVFHDLERNHLTEIDISRNPLLTNIDLGQNPITEIDLTQNPALTYVNLDYTELSEINVTQNPALVTLISRRNSIRFAITEINLTQNPALETLWLTSQGLTAINLTKNPALIEIRLTNNKLTRINLTDNTELDRAYLENNELIVINFDQNPKLDWAYLENNPLIPETIKYLETINWIHELRW